MKGYLRDRQAQEKISRWTGLGLTVAVHVVVVLCFVLTGFSYNWPPPQEKILIAFEDIDDLELEEIPPEMRGQTAADVVDPDKPVEEVRKAESPLYSDKKNNATASNPTPTGDVEIPQTQETPLDPKAIFPGHSKRDTTNTSQGSTTPTGNLTPGQAHGGPDGALDGDANATVQGWKSKTVGKLEGAGNKSGTVMVEIWIDDTGKVVDAKYTAKGSTTSDNVLIQKAIKAAKQCTFERVSKDETNRYGTVKCNFNLK